MELFILGVKKRVKNYRTSQFVNLWPKLNYESSHEQMKLFGLQRELNTSLIRLVMSVNAKQ